MVFLWNEVAGIISIILLYVHHQSDIQHWIRRTGDYPHHSPSRQLDEGWRMNARPDTGESMVVVHCSYTADIEIEIASEYGTPPFSLTSSQAIEAECSTRSASPLPLRGCWWKREPRHDSPWSSRRFPRPARSLHCTRIFQSQLASR